MRKTRRFIGLALLLGLLGLVGGMLLSGSTAVATTQEDGYAFSIQKGAGQNLVVRVYFDDRAELDAVSGQLDIWEVHHDEGYFVAMMSPEQRDWLTVLGYEVVIDPEITAGIMAPLDPRYYYFDDNYTNSNNLYMLNYLQSVTSLYDNITQLYDIGNAWQGENGGYARDIWVLRITSENPAYGAIEDKPIFFLYANTHAREVTTPEMAIRYIGYLTTGYNGQGGYMMDADVTWLVNHHVIYVLVSANPDGHRVNEASTAADRRKNMDSANGSCSSSTWGIDLNRNHSFKWGCCGGSSGYACDTTYRGPSRASEPETQAFQNYFASIFTDWNGNNGDDQIPPAAPADAMGIFISLHTYSDLVLWPWGHTGTAAPNGAQLTTIGRKFAYFNNYTPQQAMQLYTTDGTTDDWTYGKFGVASFTFEIGPTPSYSCGGFFPSYDCQDGINGASQNFWAENRPAFIYAHKIAGSPYTTAYGPDAQNLAASPSSVAAGSSFNLTANIRDLRRPGDPTTSVNAAEFFVDAPGIDGTGTPMSPVDGSWNSTNENVLGIVPTDFCDSIGKHYVLVHGRNTQGQWGPFTAIFFQVTRPPDGSCLITTESMGSAAPGSAITHTLQIDNIGLNPDTYNIEFSSAWPITTTPTLGPIAGGTSAYFDVQVTVPITAHNGESMPGVITITSQALPSILFTAGLESYANIYQPQASPASQDNSGYPGSPVVYTVQVSNQGNAPDTFTAEAAALWPVELSPAEIGPLPVGSAADLTITVTIPLTATSGENDLTTLTISSQTDPVKQATATLTTTVGLRGANVTPDLAAQAGDPGQAVIYALTVTNIGNTTDTFIVTVTDAAWPVLAPALAGPVAAGESITVLVTVTVPAEALAGAQDAAQITFTSPLPGALPDSASFETTANAVYGLAAATASDAQIGPAWGAPVTYTLLLTNTSNATDLFDISVAAGWQVDYQPVTSPLAHGEGVEITVVVLVPVGITSGQFDTAVVTITSQGNTDRQVQVTLTTTAWWHSTYLPQMAHNGSAD